MILIQTNFLYLFPVTINTKVTCYDFETKINRLKFNISVSGKMKTWKYVGNV